MANSRDYNVSRSGQGRVQTESNPGSFGNINPAVVAWRTASDYSRRKPVGSWLPPTDYSMEMLNWKWPQGSVQIFVNSGNFSFYSGYLIPNLGPGNYRNEECSKYGIPTSFPGDLANRALTKARNNLKDGSFNLGVAFAERRETARFVGDKLRAMAHTVDTYATYRTWKERWRILRRYLPRNVVDAMRELSNDILELQYALRPMMQDIHSSVKALDDRPDDDWSVVVKGSAKSVHEITGLQGPIGSVDYRSSMSKVFFGSYVRIDAILDNAALQKAASLGLTNPAAIVWEATKLSFVVDWAYPLGDYFSQLDATLGWRIKGFSHSNFWKEDWRWRGVSSTDPSSGARITPSWDSHYKHAWLSRDAGTSVPFATLPSVKDPFSKMHVLSGLALLHQAVQKFGR